MRVRICSSSEIAVGSVVRFEPEAGVAVAVARCEGGYHAVIDNCSHEDYPLSEGEVFADTCEIECVRHGSTFSLLDGEPQSLPATRPVAVYEVEVDGDDLYVVLP
ncbi:MAG: non-heme iron oxygenase ferredoxin subunit [Acidimicrobiales bacterium]